MATSTSEQAVLIGVSEVAQRLGVGKNYVYSLITAKRIPSVRLGKRRLVPTWVVADYVERIAEEQGVTLPPRPVA
jgi:excisionase family DNA binding protein